MDGRFSLLRLRAIQLLRTRAGRSSLYYGGGSLACHALRLLGIAVSTAFFPDEAFGWFAQAMMLLAFVGILGDVGIGYGLIAYQGDDPRYPRFHFTAKIALAITFIVILALAHLNTPLGREIAWAFPLLAAMFLVDAFGETGTIMAQKAFRFRALAVVEILALLGWNALLFLPIALGLSHPAWLLAAHLGHLAIRSGGGWLLEGHRYFRPCFPADLRRYFFVGYSLFAIPEGIMTRLQTTLGTLLLTQFHSRVQVGQLDRITQLIRIPTSLSVNLIDKVSMVAYSASQDDPAKLRRQVRLFLAFVLAATTLATGTLSALLPLLLPKLVDASRASELLSLWWAALPLTLLQPLSWALLFVMRGTGRPRVAAAASTLRVAAMLPLALLLVPSHAAHGVLWALAAGSLADVLFTGSMALRTLRHPRRGDAAAGGGPRP